MDLERAKKEFIKYTSNYDLENENIDRKKYHSFRVMEISEKIATNKKSTINKKRKRSKIREHR